MKNPTLTPEAKEAVRNYIFRYVALWSGLAVVLLSLLVFVLNNVVIGSAENAAGHIKNETYEKLLDRIDEARTDLSNARIEIDQNLSQRIHNAQESLRETRSDADDRLSRLLYGAQEQLIKAQIEGESAREHLKRLIASLETQTKEANALRQSIKSAKDVAEALQKTKGLVDGISEKLLQNPEFRSQLVDRTNQPNIYLLGSVKCGQPRSFGVPLEATTTEDWLVFGINPSFSSQNETRKNSSDNALFSFSTTITPTAAMNAWNIQYRVVINHASNQTKRLRLSTCPATVEHLQIVALRAYNGLQPPT